MTVKLEAPTTGGKVITQIQKLVQDKDVVREIAEIIRHDDDKVFAVEFYLETARKILDYLDTTWVQRGSLMETDNQEIRNLLDKWDEMRVPLDKVLVEVVRLEEENSHLWSRVDTRTLDSF